MYGEAGGGGSRGEIGVVTYQVLIPSISSPHTPPQLLHPSRSTQFQSHLEVPARSVSACSVGRSVVSGRVRVLSVLYVCV
jgi:hypothetical protein